jgi:hypothetical protein
MDSSQLWLHRFQGTERGKVEQSVCHQTDIKQAFILTEYSAACCVGSMLLQNLYPKGQNSVIPRPLAAGIGILKVLPVY